MAFSKHPTHVVVDLRDGYVYREDQAGLFDKARARRFARSRNLDDVRADFRYQVFELVADNPADEYPADAEPAEDRPYDIVGQIIAYESGELDDDATIELFQHLVNTGMAWSLQGSYGRAAAAMIDAGVVTSPQATR